MARTPTIPETDFNRLVAFVGTQGYDVRQLVHVPQDAARWTWRPWPIRTCEHGVIC